jgi:hypothetical protein
VSREESCGIGIPGGMPTCAVPYLVGVGRPAFRVYAVRARMITFFVAPKWEPEYSRLNLAMVMHLKIAP